MVLIGHSEFASFYMLNTRLQYTISEAVHEAVLLHIELLPSSQLRTSALVPRPSRSRLLSTPCQQSQGLHTAKHDDITEYRLQLYSWDVRAYMDMEIMVTTYNNNHR